ncbi:MAG: intraflagellar transport protein, partial [Trebouxia sp. A1-2]
DVCCWHGVSHALSKDSKTHHSAVTCLEWNAQSSILASGDDKGHVGLWRLDSSSKPGLLMHFAAASPGPVTHILFGSSSGAESDTDKATVYYSVTVGDSSHIHCADTDGHHSETFCLESQAALLGLFWHAAKSQLVSVAKTGDFYIHGEEEEGRGWQQIVKMKIGGGAGPEGPALMVAWVGDQTLASASGRDDVVRLYDLDTEDNYILRLAAEHSRSCSTDDDIRSEMSATISSLSWSVAAGILSAGTSTGRMAFWKHEQGMALSSSSSAHHMDADPSVHWLLQRGMTVAGRVNNVVWGHGDSVLAVQSGTTIHICQRGLLQRRCCGLLAAVQLSAHEVAIESMQGSNTLQVASGLQIRGLGLSETNLLLHSNTAAELSGLLPSLNMPDDVHAGLGLSETHLLLHSNTAAELYDLTVAPARMAFAFTCLQRLAPVLQGHFLFRAEGASIEVCSMAGAVEQTFVLSEGDGKPTNMEACSQFLFVFTDTSRLCMWSLSGREAKPYGGAGRVLDLPPDLLLISMRCNCDGSKVSMLTRQASSSQQQSQELFVYDVQTGTISICSFGDEGALRCPQQHFWDAEHPLLLACELAKTGNAQKKRTAAAAEAAGLEVAMLFATPQGIVLQQCQPTEACQGVVAVAAPFLYTFDTTSEAVKSHQRQVVHQTVMHTFIGMQDVDRQTSRALLDFSYHLAIGDMNEAYKAVKLVKTAGLWRSLCLSAVRSRRHQVVQFCLDNMEDVQCAQAAREFGRVAEPDARLGLVAMQLGQLEEAKKLFTCAARPDLLNKLLQACGEWDEALRVADKHDRINLKATHFRLAQHHEGMGDFAAAMKHYQLSDTHRQEVPRMLFEAEQIAQLATYVTEMNDPELLCWWGRYNESLGQFDTALEAYQQANDTVALVRLHCHQEDFVAACDVVEKSDSAAAAFMLARQLEATEQVAEAVHYFGKAQRTNHGVRLAKQHGMDSELLEQALKTVSLECDAPLQSSPLLMLDTAEYFEQRRELDKAVLLYQKAGKQRRALELCFLCCQLFDTLASIANNLTAKSDPAVMARCADFFLEHGEHEKGVQLLMQACQFSRALDVCNHNSITLTETMAEAMTPGQGTEAKEREGMLRRIAKLAKQQGSFHLACKKYTQTLDWHARPDLAQSITTFYSKAKAWDSLALFFEACAQIEIDDFRDYQKALQALQEALKYVQKSQKSSKQAVTESLTGRIAAITAFLQAQQLFGSDAASAVQMCNGLIV